MALNTLLFLSSLVLFYSILGVISFLTYPELEPNDPLEDYFNDDYFVHIETIDSESWYDDEESFESESSFTIYDDVNVIDRSNENFDCTEMAPRDDADAGQMRYISTHHFSITRLRPSFVWIEDDELDTEDEGDISYDTEDFDKMCEVYYSHPEDDDYYSFGEYFDRMCDEVMSGRDSEQELESGHFEFYPLEPLLWDL